jgi:acetylornithine deacetylase
MNKPIEILTTQAISLLKSLIATPSFSKEEWSTASLISKFLTEQGVVTSRVGNNVFAQNQYFNASKPTLLLNSHHDTVKPNPGYTRDPFKAEEIDGKLFGLGSNDAGGPLVSLIAAFLHFYKLKNLKYNIVLAATAEEEISGTNGIESIFPFLPPIDCAIVGEPTQMQMAVAERGLMVIDAVATGKAGHAAREEGENAIYKAMKDVEWLRTYHFEKESTLLGPVKLSVTVIETENKAHNVVPDKCNFVIDVRVNELYSMEEVLQTIQGHLQSKVAARSIRLKSSSIPLDHPLVKAGLVLGRTYYGSPTTSDKALMPFPALKIGPGDSARSHTADEYIYIEEINEGIALYIQMLNQILL